MTTFAANFLRKNVGGTKNQSLDSSDLRDWGL